MKDRVCTSCYHVGKPITQGIGSFAVDALIWMTFFSISLFSAIFPLMVIPILWTAYHIAIYRKSTCPKCGRINMVSKTSAKGRRALQGPTVVVSYRASDDPGQADKATGHQDKRASDKHRTSNAA